MKSRKALPSNGGVGSESEQKELLLLRERECRQMAMRMPLTGDGPSQISFSSEYLDRQIERREDDLRALKQFRDMVREGRFA